MTDIKELALKVAKDIGYWDEQEEYILDFATRLIAAYCAEQEPVAEVAAGVRGDRLMWACSDSQGSVPVGTKLYAAPPEPEGDSHE